ncbi:MAG TPA: hypothetical protein VIL85_17290 [Thermomicrobiales bacterium]|jgi:3',5'-cyclic AMP phosphodiesterase CpdA
MIDSSVPGQYHGAFNPETIDWLNRTLAGLPRDMPVLLGMRHPPIALGHPGVARARLPDVEPLAATLRRYPDVVAVLVGHTHAATVTTFAGRPLLVAPGIHSSLRLPWERAAEGESLITMAAPPGLTIHFLHNDAGGEARITTSYHTSYHTIV